MSKPIVVLKLIAALIGVVSVAGCSGQPPAAPSAASVVAGDASVKPPQGVRGVYDLSFAVLRNGTLEPVTSLSVSSAELILEAHVSDSAGNPAQQGTVTFEYCSYKGGPPNDISRADEAPKEACEQGLASWARLTSVAINAGSCPTLGAGYACMDFGIVRIPRTVGFRFRYSAQGGVIASGVSEAKNFIWVAGS
jgi:hypothetical protein